MSEILLEEDYWRIEYNERSEGQKSYIGETVTEEILNEIRELDEKWYIAYLTENDELQGYAKFYFEHIQNGKIIDQLRIDVGDGSEVNKKYFDYIQSQLIIK